MKLAIYVATYVCMYMRIALYVCTCMHTSYDTRLYTHTCIVALVVTADFDSGARFLF